MPLSSRCITTGCIPRSMTKNVNNSDVAIPSDVPMQTCIKTWVWACSQSRITRHTGSVVTSGTRIAERR